jgi:hypothetical protein
MSEGATMKATARFAAAVACALVSGLTFTSAIDRAADALPSWNDGKAKQAIIDFVQAVADVGRDTFVAVSDRVAVFDNDGTLWSEQPMYFQLVFAFDRIKALAPNHPEWKTTQPFKGVLENDMQAALAGGERSVMAVLAATHAGVTTEQFSAAVTDWLEIMAFGNSDGDLQMLEWTTAGRGPRIGLIVHHTDADREWAYARTSRIGQLIRGLDEAQQHGWIVADMKKDWNAIYPLQKPR